MDEQREGFEAAYERHLEDRGYWDARADEQRYLSMGIHA